jgi:hypothetical protein
LPLFQTPSSPACNRARTRPLENGTYRKRIAAPLIGGLLSAVLLTLVILPAIYTIWKGFEVRRRAAQPAPVAVSEAAVER